MNIISCDNCGVVLDAKKLVFPDDWESYEGVDDTKAKWDGEEWVPCCRCPICDNKIPKPS